MNKHRFFLASTFMSASGGDGDDQTGKPAQPGSDKPRDPGKPSPGEGEG